MERYIFPMNYKFSAKFLGLIDYSTLLPFSIYAGSIIALLYFLKVDFFLSFGIVIILIIPPLLLLSIGINRQPAIPYVIAVYKFYKNNKFYLYKNDCQIS